MNKARVDALLPTAYDVLAEVRIANQGRIPKTYRGYIASFGAAVSGGSLLAAIAFFSEQGGAEKDRTKLMKALDLLVYGEQLKDERPQGTLFEHVRKAIVTGGRNRTGIDAKKEAACKEKIIDAAIALKLAMNLYELTE